MPNHFLDVAIGLSYTFLATSLLCSATREAIASLFQTRAKVLLDGILTLLHETGHKHELGGVWPSIQRLLRLDGGFGLRKLDPGNEGSLAAAVMTHPLITGLAGRGCLPSYIPSPIFARALVTVLKDAAPGEACLVALAKLGSPRLLETLLAIMGDGPQDCAALENAVRIWYEMVMDRITGWYKRRSQLVLFLIGLFYAAAMNIDAIELTQRLWSDQAAAARLAEQGADAMPALTARHTATGVTPPPAPSPGTATAPASGVAPIPVLSPVQAPGAVLAQVGNQLEVVKALPIGWPSPRFEAAGKEGTWRAMSVALVFALMGWIVTGFAASLGSPFWFDGIGGLLALRGTGAKPPGEGAAAPREPVRLPGTPPKADRS